MVLLRLPDTFTFPHMESGEVMVVVVVVVVVAQLSALVLWETARGIITIIIVLIHRHRVNDTIARE